MGWSAPDIYGQPEKFGLTPIGEVEWTEPCYSFDTTVVWRHEDGRLFWASDAGCSCPSPFEDFTGLDSAETGTVEELNATLQAKLTELRSMSWHVRDAEQAQVAVVDLLAKVRSAA